MSTTKIESDQVQANLFDPPPQRPEWEKLPLEIQVEATQLLTELLASPAAERLLSQGGPNE
jgi:hypothetical protein